MDEQNNIESSSSIQEKLDNFGCRSLIGLFILGIILLIFWIGVDVINYVGHNCLTPKIEIIEENDIIKTNSKYVYIKFEKLGMFFRERGAPGNEVVMNLYGIHNKTNNERQYYIMLYYGKCIQKSDRDKILKSRNIISYTPNRTNKDFEEGELIIYGCDILFYPPEGAPIHLPSGNSVIFADTHFSFNNAMSSYMRIYTHIQISEEQLRLLADSNIQRIYHPISIGIDDLQTDVDHKSLQILYQRYELVKEELDKRTNKTL